MTDAIRAHPAPRKPGFTMVELLVVITVVVVLAGIIMAVIPGIRGRALMAADTSKLRQIGVALASYAGERNNTLPNSNDPIPGTATSSNDPDRWNFHECVDRYLGPPDSKYNPGSVYNHLRRPDSPFYSRAARPYPGWTRSTSYPNVLGPMAFGFNPNINHGTRWRGRLDKIPRLGSTVIMAEFNRGGSSMNPGVNAEFEDDVETRYRVSRPGKTALYLYADYHIGVLQGDHSYQYYASHPDETNIWRWW